eukprot:scaffold71_cov174-Alexandrium_tamarense.AAC.7
MTSTLKNEITSAFTTVGLTSLPAPLVTKLTGLSTSLRLTPRQLAEAWEAHSLTRNVDVLDDVTFGGYQSALAKEAESKGLIASSSVDSKRNVVVMQSSGLGKRTAPHSSVTPSPMAKRGAQTPQSASGATAPADRSGLSAVDNLTTPSGKVPISPGMKHPGVASANQITPTAKSAPKYQDRTGTGSLVTSYNPNSLPTAVEVNAQNADNATTQKTCTIQYHPSSTHPQPPTKSTPFRHMFTPLATRAKALESRILTMSDSICEKYNIKSEEEEMLKYEHVSAEVVDDNMACWTPVGIPKQGKVVCVGRICNEAHEGRLNRASIRLEGSRKDSSGSRIHLDLNSLVTNNDNNQSYSFFPGQIVAVEGINSSGRTMQASRLYEGVPPPVEKSTAKELIKYNYGPDGQNGMPLSIVSMCGPFTTKDNLEYDPLVDMVMKISEDQPDVVIMCGPFVDGRQPLVQGGEPTITDEDGNEKKVSYENLFQTKFAALLEEMYANDPDTKTQFVLVPSTEDMICESVYPQPPLVNQEVTSGVKKFNDEFGNLGLNYVEIAGRENIKTSERTKRVHCVSNPCTLKINELSVGVTSSDVLFHISSDETNANLPPGGRLTRIAQHLIQQRSYYPLFPAAKGACLDLSRSDEWEMPVQPDILIVPSKLTTFARKVLDTTVVVNPGELTKNTTGGTYAVIDVHPMKKEALEKGGDAEMEHGVQDRVRVDIKRI